MRAEASVEINRPIHEVYDRTTMDVAQWSKSVVEDRLIEATADGVGTRFHCVTEENGQRMEFDGVVTRHEPPYAHAVTLTGKMFDIDAAYRFEELDGRRTRVTELAILHGKGLLKPLFWIVGTLLGSANSKPLKEELQRLKAYCERMEEPPMQGDE